jgi:uncharacterized membrane protein YqjE
MANQDVHNDLTFSGALQQVVDRSQNVMLAYISSLRIEIKEDLGRALSSLLLIGAGVILLNGAWISLTVAVLHQLNDHLSLLASLAIVGSLSGLIGAGLALAGVRQLRQLKVEPDAARIERADSAL